MHNDNAPQWKGAADSFYEVWYIKLNLPSKDGKAPALWLRFTLLVMQGGIKRVAEVWGVCFEPDSKGGVQKTAIKNTSNITGALQFTQAGDVRIEDSVLASNYSRGSVVSRGKEIHWDLSFTPNDYTVYYVPKILNKLKLAKSTFCKPNVDIKFTGSFTVNGRKYECDGNSAGAQGHIWGTRYAHGWAWSHCNAFDSPNHAILEILTARVKLGGVLLSPQMSSLFLEYKGDRYELNSLWNALTIRSSYDTTKWVFSAEKGKLRIAGEIECAIRDLVGVTYEDTIGGYLYCYNTALASQKLTLYFGGKLEETLFSRATTSFETVVRDKNPYVEVLL